VSFSEETLYLYRFFIAFYCGRLDIAGDILHAIRKRIELQNRSFLTIYFLFLSVLTDINLNRNPKRIKGHLKRLKRYASYNSAIYKSKYCLALGDSLRMKGSPGAVDAYQDAVSAAKENGFLFEQALACEGLGKVFKKSGDEKKAGDYLGEAVRLYRKWGLKWRHGLFDIGTKERPEPEETFTGQENRVVIPAQSQGLTEPQIGVPAAERMIDHLLINLKDLSGAAVIHAAHQQAQFWKSLVYIDESGIHRPATFVPLPGKMISFASATGEVVQADVYSIEEQLLDTAYFLSRRPSSVMVIPGKERNAVYIENYETIPDRERFIQQAEQVLSLLEPNPAAGGLAGGIRPEDEQQLTDQCRILQKYMINQKAYQNPSLSLAGLAKEVRMPKRTITDALNTCLGQNFKNFVNSYRIEAVKQAFGDPAFGHNTILEIAFAMGFNSKSAFNDVFKSMVGTTPSDYRDRLTRKEMN
jgi:AraC-like DNA-binding protein